MFMYKELSATAVNPDIPVLQLIWDQVIIFYPRVGGFQVGPYVWDMHPHITPTLPDNYKTMK